MTADFATGDGRNVHATHALFFAIDTRSTRDTSGIVPAANGRMPGASESSCGVLPFGMSTAFIFAAIQADFPAIAQRLQRDRPPR